jgi:D-alanine-D-alanine ligase
MTATTRPTRPLQVLHLVGSAVDDFHAELSCVYARACLHAVDDPTRYTPRVAFVAPDGSWSFPTALDDAALAVAPRVSLPEALAALAADRPDVVVPQMFCLPGMTHYRALLELIGVPSVGNSAGVMMLAMDKVAARGIVAQAGVRVPRADVVRRGDPVPIELPAVVKPAAADNSAGVSLVRRDEDLQPALEAAWDHGEVALVERYVELGREVRCGTIVRDGELVALPLEEYAVDAATRPIRDAADKLARDPAGRLELVAKDASRAWIVPTDDPVNDAVAAAARACHVALGCGHHGLFDFRIDPDGHPWFLEAGPYCSFGRNSVVPTMAAAAGIPVTELFADAVAQALAPPGTAHPARPPDPTA